MKSFRLTLVAAGAAVCLLATGVVLGAMASTGAGPKRAHDTPAVQAAAVGPKQTGVASVTGDPTAAQLLDMTRACDEVSGGKYAMREGGRGKISVCKKKSAYFWTSDMAIDCDGERTDACNPDTDSTFSEGTNFKTSTGEYFTADVTRYFVIPLPSYRFDYRDAGIKPGNVGAVVYDNKLVYAVFADLGPPDSIGEASYATAKALGVETDPSIGGTAGPVTFIVFPGVVPDPVEENAVITRVGTAAARSFLGMDNPSAPRNPAPAPARASTPKPAAPPARAQEGGSAPKPTDALAGDVKKTPAAKKTLADGAKKTAAVGPAKTTASAKTAGPTKTAGPAKKSGPTKKSGSAKTSKPKPPKAQAPEHKPTPKPTKVQAAGPKKAPTHLPAPASPAATTTGTQQRDDRESRDDTGSRDDSSSQDDTSSRNDSGSRDNTDSRDDEDRARAGSGGATGPIGSAGGRCVDAVPSGMDADRVQLHGCDGSEEQTWTIRDDGTISVLGGCLAVTGGSAGDGAQVQVRECDGSDSQQWAPNDGRLVNVNARRCLDAPSGTTADGTPLQIWACSYGANQQWSLPDESAG